MLFSEEVPRSHDEAVTVGIQLKDELSKKRVTDNFLSSLSSRDLKYRSGLSSLAILQSLPMHSFMHRENEGPEYQCGICACNSTCNLKSLAVSKFAITSVGSFASYGDIYAYALCLKLQDILEPKSPKETDVKIFSEMIAILRDLPSDATANDAQKAIRKIKGFKSNEEERRYLLETLGYCGILETEEHAGFLTKFTKLGLAPSKSHNSDWSYPVSWWTGKDSVNHQALDYWFHL